MTDDLRQIELGAEFLAQKEIDLLRDRGMRVCPAAEHEARLMTPDLLAEIPGVFDAPRAANGLVAAPHDVNPRCFACLAYDRQKSSECLLVRNGTTIS